MPLLLFPVHATAAPLTLGSKFVTGSDLLAAASVLLSPDREELLLLLLSLLRTLSASASASAFGATEAEAGFEPGVDSAGGDTRHSLVTCSIFGMGKEHREQIESYQYH